MINPVRDADDLTLHLDLERVGRCDPRVRHDRQHPSHVTG